MGHRHGWPRHEKGSGEAGIPGLDSGTDIAVSRLVVGRRHTITSDDFSVEDYTESGYAYGLLVLDTLRYLKSG